MIYIIGNGIFPIIKKRKRSLEKLIEKKEYLLSFLVGFILGSINLIKLMIHSADKKTFEFQQIAFQWILTSMKYAFPYFGRTIIYCFYQ